MLQPWFIITSGLGVILLGFIASTYLVIKWSAAPYLYGDPEMIPPQRIALILGTARYVHGGEINLYFRYRMDAAEALYRSRRIRHFIVSGADKHGGKGDQAEAMKTALMKRGIPSEMILVDDRGYRTWDSLWICRERFKCLDPVVVSQRFHLERAIFIARNQGMTALGFNAKKVKGRSAFRMVLRECLARVKCLLDCFILHPAPYYLRKRKPK